MTDAHGCAPLAPLLPNETSSSGASSPAKILNRSAAACSYCAEDESNLHFTLAQNQPNPYLSITVIPFTLVGAADVQLDIFGSLGRKVTSIVRKALKTGEQIITLNLSGLGLATGHYVYHLQVTNSSGVYCQRKMMTIYEAVARPD